jgi:tRNA pseudouridine55 synthase
LGTRAHVTLLRRTAVGGFDEAGAITIEQIEAAVDRDALLRPISIALSHLPELRIAPEDAALLRNGGAILLRGGNAPIAIETAWASLNGQAVALGSVRAGHFHPSRVLRG